MFNLDEFYKQIDKQESETDTVEISKYDYVDDSRSLSPFFMKNTIEPESKLEQKSKSKPKKVNIFKSPEIDKKEDINRKIQHLKDKLKNL